MDFSNIFFGLCQFFHVSVIIVVHHDDVIENAKIFFNEFSGTRRKIVSAPLAVHTHPVVGQFAFVPTRSSGRIH